MESTTKPTIVITGASGLIGTRLVDVFHADFDVFALDIKEPESSQARAKARWLDCDLTDDAGVRETVSTVRERCNNRIASVIHLAAYYDFSGEPSPLYEKLTVEGTRRLLRELQAVRVEQFIFSSSLLVMDPVEKGEVLTESSSTEAEWDYPRSKLAAERVIQEERGRIPVVILRIAGAYDEDCHSVPIAQQIARIYEKNLESFVFPGDASHGQAFVHLDDVADCIRKTVEKRDELSEQELFLIGEPGVMSYAALQDSLGSLVHGEEWPTIRVPKTAAKAGAWIKEKLGSEEESFIKPWMIDLADDHYPVAIDRARQRLGWSPNHRLENTLADMVRRLKANPKEWYEENNLDG